MTQSRLDPDRLVRSLREIVGTAHVLTGAAATRGYVTGYRGGGGAVSAVVRPGGLVELWRVLKACHASGAIVIMQAANTGLTGGSTPCGDYRRDVVLISTLRIKGVYPIEAGRQVVCLPGSTLYELEDALRPLGREPHSVIGSSCIGASVIGGICNTSGGALIQRGPAYTELALYARIDEQGELVLVNHLGIVMEGPAETILTHVETGVFPPATILHDQNRRACDDSYAERVRDVDAETPARFNADPKGLFEASGSAGKVVLFAVRLDTFPVEADSATFYIGSNSIADLAQLRRNILQDFAALPISGEYVHRTAFDVAARYGKDLFLAIEKMGTGRLTLFFAWKNRFDGFVRRLPFKAHHLSDRLLQFASTAFKQHLPPRMRAFRDAYEHHLILKMGSAGAAEARAYLAGRYPSAQGDFFECSSDEAAKAFLHRFAVAAAAVRYQALHEGRTGGLIALDIALARNDMEWFERLPPAIGDQIELSLYYGHFFCHVLHQDYIVRHGCDAERLKQAMLALLDERGAEYPAEHNVGHIYAAKPALLGHYRALDPTNSFNPGIGRTSREPFWGHRQPVPGTIDPGLTPDGKLECKLPLDQSNR